MMSEHLACGLRGRLLATPTLIIASLLAGCGGDDTSSTTSIGPTGIVSLSITGFLNDAGEEFERDNSGVTLSCSGSISVKLGPIVDGTLENWLLRPPGACSSVSQCGYITLDLLKNGKLQVSKSGVSTSILLTATPGTYTLRASLWTGDGEAFLQDGEPVQDSLDNLELLAPTGCTSTSTASTSGGGSAGADASSTTTNSGAGGAGGAGGAAGAASLVGGAAGQAGASG